MKVRLKIVSGAQAGADRAALDVAIALGLEHGGWCPKGRKAEDGSIDPRYQLKETPTSRYVQRTEWNVRDSDGTVVFTIADKLSGGSRKTAEFATKHGKPWLHIAQERIGPNAVALLKQFIVEHQIRVLNVAGSRASKEPDVGRFVERTLRVLLSDPANAD